MNDFILNNILLIVMQDMIREVISDIVPDMVRSIVREELTSVREEVTIVREAVTSLREEVRSELQLFYVGCQDVCGLEMYEFSCKESSLEMIIIPRNESICCSFYFRM